MNDGALDIAILVIMLYFLLRGIFRGLVKEVVALAGIFVAFWLAGMYWPIGAEHLSSLDENISSRAVISFLVIFFIVYFIIGLISIFADKIVKLTISPLLSAILGATAGIVKGALICAILLGSVESFLKPNNPLFTTSAIWPSAQHLVSVVKACAPDSLRKAMDSRPSVLTGALTPPPQSSQGGSAPAATAATRPALPAGPITADWKSIQAILADTPEAISPAWRDKLRGLTDASEINPEDLKRFVQDHPALFAPAPESLSAPAAPPAPPQWAQPAGE